MWNKAQANVPCLITKLRHDFRHPGQVGKKRRRCTSKHHHIAEIGFAFQ
ncbi:Uncharacterised protein [Vibrio cholerae]|nr:Uncharacterised protein [Vibrio cholerae]